MKPSKLNNKIYSYNNKPIYIIGGIDYTNSFRLFGIDLENFYEVIVIGHYQKTVPLVTKLQSNVLKFTEVLPLIKVKDET